MNGVDVLSKVTPEVWPRWTEAARNEGVGQFTSSDFANLIVEKPGALKGYIHEASNGVVFGSTALGHIASVLAERTHGLPSGDYQSRAMERGTDLEPVAKELLSRHWMELEEAQRIHTKYYSSSAPDNYAMQGKMTVDVKCPADGGDVLLFELSVADGSHEDVKRWNKDYYWQVLHQQYSAGVMMGSLVLFDDRQPLIPCDVSEFRDLPGTCFTGNGFAFAAKRCDLTEELALLIDRTLYAAEETLLMMHERWQKKK